MRNKLVSIIIPAYNAEAFVREAIDSALGQTYQPVEVIVVNDGSKDRTRDVVESYGDRIKFISQENQGLAAARNSGIREAKGDYLAFLDSDDVFLPEKVEKQVAALEANPDFQVCYSDLLHFKETNGGKRKFYHHRYEYPSGNLLAPLLRKQFINPVTVLARREIFEKCGIFDPNLRRSEDWDLWLRWAKGGAKFLHLGIPLAHYRVQTGGENLSSLRSEPQMKEKNLELFERFGKGLTEEERKRFKYPKILRGLSLKTAVAYLLVGDKEHALKYAPSKWQKILIRFLPVEVARLFLIGIRKIKHRLLLKKKDNL